MTKTRLMIVAVAPARAELRVDELGWHRHSRVPQSCESAHAESETRRQGRLGDTLGFVDHERLEPVREPEACAEVVRSEHDLVEAE